MRPLVTLAVLALCSSALAGSVPIRTLLTGSGGQLNAGASNFVVVKRTGDLKRFELGVIVANARAGHITDLILAVKSNRLTAAEMELFRGNASFVATRCFGLETRQLPNFSAWLEELNAGSAPRTTAAFGKVNAVFVRQNKPGAPYTTLELYRDADQPGVRPWLNDCLR